MGAAGPAKAGDPTAAAAAAEAAPWLQLPSSCIAMSSMARAAMSPAPCWQQAEGVSRALRWETFGAGSLSRRQKEEATSQVRQMKCVAASELPIAARCSLSKKDWKQHFACG